MPYVKQAIKDPQAALDRLDARWALVRRLDAYMEYVTDLVEVQFPGRYSVTIPAHVFDRIRELWLRIYPYDLTLADGVRLGMDTRELDVLASYGIVTVRRA